MGFIWNIFGVLVFSLFKSEQDLKLEIIALRQQLIVLQRKAPKRLNLTKADRLLFVWLYRVQPDILNSVRIIKPETVVRWHRKGFKAYWTWKCRRHWPGRPKIDKELRDLIRQMCRENPLWGAPRIHGELLKLGFDVAQSTVAKYMLRPRKPPSQTWRTFLRNHADGIAAVDFFVVPSINFQLLFVFIVISHTRRRLLHFAVTTNPTAEWTARQIVEAFPWDSAPRYLIRDNDNIYGLTFQNKLRALEIKEVRTAPRSPWQNAYAERLIGTMRRDCTDHVVVFGRRHLWRILRSYADYYNSSRTHLSLKKDCPDHRRSLPKVGKVVSFPQVGGLHHRYDRLAA